MPSPFRIGFLVFPNITQLDLTGPYEVFAQMPGAELHLVWKTREPVKGSGGLTLTPSTTFAECPQLDLICVPGGGGMNALLTDAETLDFLRRQAKGARYVTAVCTGALVLGAAGLLNGKRAATHWMSMEFLKHFGAVPANERVVIDGNVITGGGVTAGIDFALRVVAEIAGERGRARDPAFDRIRPAPAVRERASAQRRPEAGRGRHRACRPAPERAPRAGREGGEGVEGIALLFVMAGLVTGHPRLHLSVDQDVDARYKAGHDEKIMMLRALASS